MFCPVTLLHASLDFLKIVRLSEHGTPFGIHDIMIQRIQDCIAILNRIITRWNNFQSSIEQQYLNSTFSKSSIDIEDSCRIETIDDTFSFITFLFLLIGFYHGIDDATYEVINKLSIDTSCLTLFPEEKGIIYDLRKLRNKMVAHTAHIEPRSDDTLPNRYAYLRWYVGHWGLDTNFGNRRLNTFGIEVDGNSSTHIIPPEFDKMVVGVQLYIEECGLTVRNNVQQIVNALSRNPSIDFVVLKNHYYSTS